MRHSTSDRGLVLRRQLLEAGGGFAGLALAHLMSRELAADELSSADDSTASPAGLPNSAPSVPRPEFNGGLHHIARARRVIQLFMNGGASQMDTFDYKPELARLDGQMLGPKVKPEGQVGESGAVMKSPFEFKQYGETGRWVSSVFPEQAKVVDHMAFLNAMQTKTSVHGPGSFMMNTGFLLPGFPCMGAWVSWALGRITDDLPEFIVLPDVRGLPYNQKSNFSSGFLPARHQGTIINATGTPPVPDLFPDRSLAFASPEADRDSLSLLESINRRHAAAHPGDSRLEARIASYELAAKMQLSAPEAFDLSQESAEMQAAYGIGNAPTDDFGRRCLLARRLIERGTRFVQVWSGPQGATDNWDNHGSIVKELPPIAASVDKPIAALLNDLFQRGLMDDTLVIWTTEFGRTAFSQSGTGRDHNGGCFQSWLAGAGVKAGASYGASDDLGHKAADGITTCHDLHATILHLLGIDHERLTFRTSGINRRLTDVHGHVVAEILA